MTIKDYYSAAELADLKLPSLPATRENVYRRATREAWPHKDVAGFGGRGGVRREFEVPAYVRAEIIAKQGMTPEESLKVLDNYLARTDTKTPLSEQKVIRISDGKAVEEPRTWAICSGAVQMFAKMYKVSMNSQQEHDVTEAAYRFMLARKRMGKTAELEDLADVIKKTMVA
ncbi:DNA-binding protein [Iodobacter sp.]|uniref:DNA-binding protein n=1 Tax=Iodobacter sp. TaxID=1915058 RepID=UPI0025D6F49B|nr:DNA-binding protein [Iodobacter sp.]